jgi:hypothetical protein
VTAGTIFHATRTPLTIWFTAAWHVTAQKNGISALGLKRVLGLGSEQTAWAMLHRFRTAMGRTSPGLLSGRVEVDETYVGGPEPGRRGRGALGKTTVGVAVEVDDSGVIGRCRLEVLPNTSWKVLQDFLRRHVELTTTIVSDGWVAYERATRGLYVHEPTNVKGSGRPAHEALPGVHLVAALVKRWLLGTHQGGVKPEHLDAYLTEFSFRFNRRRSRSRGLVFMRLLEGAVASPPRSYKSLVTGPRKNRKKPPVVPLLRRVSSATLASDPVWRPWRRQFADATNTGTSEFA